MLWTAAALPGLPASEESSAVPAHRPEAPAVELSSPDGVVTPVVYQGDGVYRMGESQPADGATDLYDLFCLAAEEILPEGELPRVNSISAPKGYYVEWDLSADWLERYTVDELEWFGNTLWMTLSWNSRDIASMAFLVDGQPGLLGEDTWQAPPLRLLRDPTAVDFTAIRAQVPYSGLVPVADHGDAEYDFMPQELQDDPVALEIRPAADTNRLVGRVYRAGGCGSEKDDHHPDLGHSLGDRFAGRTGCPAGADTADCRCIGSRPVYGRTPPF